MATIKLNRRGTLWLFPIMFAIAAVSLIASAGMQDIPAETKWASSGHADETSEAFLHWGPLVLADPLKDPCSVRGSCAKCHTGIGFLGFLGEPLPPGTIPNQAALIECIACHNDTAIALDSVIFPSGVEVTGLNAEARCMQCHQGRQSTVSVNDYIAGKAPATEDTVDSSMSFRNVHYAPAGATLIGGEAMVGYQYDGKMYDHRFAHVEGIDTCIDCHDPHSLAVKEEICADCHDAGVDAIFTVEDLHDARLEGSTMDYDGDGDALEGIYHEIHDLMDTLYTALRDYCRVVAGTPIGYGSGYPYFFVDPNDNGIIETGEDTRYNAWTARSLKAAFNYQYALKDHGAYAHNGKYVIQLLMDSIEDLDAALVTAMHREDAGHFAGSTEAWRHWDEDGAVPGRCARCHSATGLPFYLEADVNVEEPLSNGMLCTTCHSEVPGYARIAVDDAEFPSSLTASFGAADDSNLCIQCHQGRASTASVQDKVAGLGDDEGNLTFTNVHYFPAGATVFASEVKGAFEFMGKSYNGRFEHLPGFIEKCTDCHEKHSGEITGLGCACHPGVPLESIRLSVGDYDGDGDALEGIHDEIETMHEALYAAIQDYATNVVGVPIIYDSHGYPYFFKDTNGNGAVDPGENIYPNRYINFTPRLLKAAYNYQYVVKDPGAFAHNGQYMIQILYDNLEDLGVDVSGMIRPPLKNSPAACGDLTHPTPEGDFNGDCVNDIWDMVIFVNNWLIDNNIQ